MARWPRGERRRGVRLERLAQLRDFAATFPLVGKLLAAKAQEQGWHLDRIQHLLGGEEYKGNFARWLVIDLDQPKVATVYVIASET